MYMLKLPAVDILELFRRFDLNDASDLQDVNFVRRDIPDMNKIFIDQLFTCSFLNREVYNITLMH
jgi:hypothetical protein